MNMDLSSSDCDRPDEDVDQSVDLISNGFNQQLDLQCNEDHKDCENEEQEEEEEDDDDFTFMSIGEDEGPSYDDKVFEDGRIGQVFPLFDQKLLKDGEYDIEEIDRFPILPSVDKIFIESPRGFQASKHEENEDTASGPYCAWSKDSATAAAELSKKSNSTGFSKLWRLREKVGRSNSDGRDAFVFMKSTGKLTASTTTSSKPVISDGTFVKVNGGKARVTKAKKSTVSAHEAYLRSRGHTDEERRRSYLPYRPELMGLFTNVHVGLSKNVHPY